MAKFPKPDDTRDIAAGEILALTLAAQAGIQVAEHRLVPVGGHGVAVITRFDRFGKNRIPFISAVTLLGPPKGEPGAYRLLADGIRQFGHDVPGDLRELWRRLAYSLLASALEHPLWDEARRLLAKQRSSRQAILHRMGRTVKATLELLLRNQA